MPSSEPLASSNRPTAHVMRWASLDPARLVPNIVTGVVIGALLVTFSISMATLLYGAPLADQLDRAIGLAMLGTLAVALCVMLLGSGTNVVAHVQDAPTAVLAATVAGIVGAGGVSEAAAASDTLPLFMTASATVGLATLTTGALLLLVGQFRLGRLVRYLPYPVIGGFMAGTGWLILSGGWSVMTGEPFGVELFSGLLAGERLATWLPGTLLAVLLLVVSRRSPHFLAWPVAILGAALLFYLAVLVSGRPLEQWRAAGHLLGPFPDADLLQGLAPADLALVDWSAVLAQLPTIVTVAGLSLLAVLLNSTAIELLSERRSDLDRELRAAGIGNLLTGAVTGQIGYQSVSMTNLNLRAGDGSRTPLVIAMAVLSGTLLFGASLLEYVPTLLVGGLIAFLGLDFLYEWLVEAYSRLSVLEYGVVVIILLVIAAAGFLTGVAVGLLLAVALFVVNYARIDAVRHTLDGNELRSRVRRDPDELSQLFTSGAEVLVLQLQGYLFFGSTNKVLERIEQRSRSGPLRSVILDFRRVTGVDADATVALRRLLALGATAGYRLYLSDLSARVLADLRRRGLGPALEAGAVVFPTLDAALEDCENHRLSVVGSSEEPESATLARALGVSAAIDGLLPYLERLELEAGERLIEQGDPPDAVYFVARGRLTAWLAPPDGERMRLESLRAGGVVGEVAFLTGEPRSASVVADEASVVYQLSAAALERLTAAAPSVGAAVATSLAKLTAGRVRHLMGTVTALQR